MLKAVLLFVVGLVCLIKGGDFFVDGASSLAHRFHIPELLIGATVVSIGTTLPEVMVSATSALQGHGEIAYGNAIGSIICNTALIAAITIAIKPKKVNKKELVLPLTFFFTAAVFYSAVAYTKGYFSQTVGLILLGGFVTYMILVTRQALQDKKQNNDNTESDSTDTNPLIKDIVLLVAGAALIALGANLLVDNGTIIATQLGVPESVIALTFVALGTSLPELVTAITSLVKGHDSLSLGNIIGANLFNLVLVSGVSVTLSPFELPAAKMIGSYNASLVVDIPLMFIVMMLMSLPALIKGKLSRIQGILLLVIYFGFCVFQFVG